MPKQTRLDAPGTLHHVIIRGVERGDIVSDEGDRADFVTPMGKLSKETDSCLCLGIVNKPRAYFIEKRQFWPVKIYEKTSDRICRQLQF